MANVVVQAGNRKDTKWQETDAGGLLLHPTEEGVVVFVWTATAARMRLAVVFLVGKVVVVHVHVLALVVAVAVAHAALLRRHHGVARERVRGAIEVYELGRQRGHWRDVGRQVDSTRLGGAVRAAQQADSSSHVLVSVAVVGVGAGHRGARGGGPVGHVAPVAVVAVGIGVAVVGEDGRLVRLAVRGAVGRVALDGAAAKVQVRVRRVGADGVVVHVRGRGGFGGAQVVAHVR